MLNYTASMKNVCAICAFNLNPNKQELVMNMWDVEERNKSWWKTFGLREKIIKAQRKKRK